SLQVRIELVRSIDAKVEPLAHVDRLAALVARQLLRLAELNRHVVQLIQRRPFAAEKITHVIDAIAIEPDRRCQLAKILGEADVLERAADRHLWRDIANKALARVEGNAVA